MARIPTVDLHHHFLPHAVFDRLADEAGGAPRLINDRISITLTPDLADADVHTRTMRQGGVDKAVLTYSGVSILGPDICRQLNSGFADLQSSYKGVLYGAAHVCLTDPNAPRELEHGIRELGLVAVALPTSMPGVVLDQPSLEPVWRTISELGIPVILHPALLPQGATTDYALERSCARPFDTTIAAARLAYGVIPGFPKLTFILPHLGGTTVFLRGRISMFFDTPDVPQPSEKRSLAKTQREQHALGLDRIFADRWSSFYVDTAGTGGWAPAVEMAARVVGTGRMVFGSDYPLESYSSETVSELVQMVAGLPLDQADRDRILGGNAMELLRLD